MRTPFRHLPASIRHIVSSSGFKWIGRKRGEAGAAIAAMALVDIVWGKAEPIDLLEPSLSAFFTLSWLLLLTGVAIRIWAAGNLEKNREITTAAIYRMVRHPLYLATWLMYLAYFLAFGDALLGVLLFAATVGVFLMPWVLAAAAAQQLQRALQHPWSQAFGRGAAPAVVGLLGVTALHLARHTFAGWPYALIALVALVLALWTKVHPILILIGGAVAGAIAGSFAGAAIW
jgi:protein-S-isoprenylcysteine O-methyltransferase Ste14